MSSTVPPYLGFALSGGAGGGTSGVGQALQLDLGGDLPLTAGNAGLRSPGDGTVHGLWYNLSSSGLAEGQQLRWLVASFTVNAALGAAAMKADQTVPWTTVTWSTQVDGDWTGAPPPLVAMPAPRARCS